MCGAALRAVLESFPIHSMSLLLVLATLLPQEPVEATSPRPGPLQQPVELINPSPVAREGLVFCSVPFARGVLRSHLADSAIAVVVGLPSGAVRAPARPLMRWPDGSLALIQVQVHCAFKAAERLPATVEPVLDEAGVACAAPARDHDPAVLLPLPLWTEVVDPWNRTYRSQLVPDETAGPGGVVFDTGLVRLQRFRSQHLGVDDAVKGHAFLDLTALLMTFDGGRNAELTLVLDNREPLAGPLGPVRFRGFRLITSQDDLRFLPAYAVENLLPPPRPRSEGGFVQWLLAPGDAHYLADGSAKAFRLQLFQDGEDVDAAAREAASWAHARLWGCCDLDAVRHTRVFGPHGGPAPKQESDSGTASAQLATWRRTARFGPYGSFGDPQEVGLRAAPRHGDSMLHNVLRWRSPELLVAAEGMVLQQGLRPSGGRPERTPADTAAYRQGLPQLARRAPHGFVPHDYEHVSAHLLFDYYWLCGDEWAREELARLGRSIVGLLASARFRTSRGEGNCLEAGVLCARATGDVELVTTLDTHARTVLLPLLDRLDQGVAVVQPPHLGVLDGKAPFDAPWQMAQLVRGLTALAAAGGSEDLNLTAVQVAHAMATSGWVDGAGPKTFVGVGAGGRYSMAALPVDRAGRDRITLGAFVLAAELATDATTDARLRECGRFVLDRDLSPDAGLAAQLSAAANPWLQIALDRRAEN